jgi:hypothetical protein
MTPNPEALIGTIDVDEEEEFEEGDDAVPLLDSCLTRAGGGGSGGFLSFTGILRRLDACPDLRCLLPR